MLRANYCTALAVLLCAQPAAADNPRKVAISPTSPKGALLFKSPRTPVHHMLLFTRGDDGSSGREYWVGIEPWIAAKGDRFVVTTLPPGRYRLEAVYQQDKWVACLQANSPTVTIEPGRIAYLGTLDTRPTLASIQSSARARNELKASLGQWHFYRAGILPPQMIDRDPGGLAQAEQFVRQEMPRSSAMPTLADVQWAPYQALKPSGRGNRCD